MGRCSCRSAKVWRVNKRLRRAGPAVSARDLALTIGRKGFRRSTWREGTKEPLWSRFALRRVVPAHDDGTDPAHREDVWLLMEWPDGEREPTKYFMATLPRRTPRKQIVRIIKERYRTERLYEDLKGELGLDHFEGRSFPGWHHHISVALCCYAFVLSERVRRFPPRPDGRWATTRSRSRPERHFHDSFITARLAIARHLTRWLPRCPLCHQAQRRRHAAAHVDGGFSSQ